MTLFGELAAAFRIVGGDGLVAGVEAEAAVFPVQELAGFPVAEELFADEGRDEAVAEEFGEGFEGLDGDLVEAALAVVETGGGEDVEVGVKSNSLSIARSRRRPRAGG